MFRVNIGLFAAVRLLNLLFMRCGRGLNNFTAEIMFPGDPEAAPVDIYNCRCTLLSAINGYEIDTSNTDLRHDKNLGKMTYDEWLDAKAPVTSNPIDLPEKKAAAFTVLAPACLHGHGPSPLNRGPQAF